MHGGEPVNEGERLVVNRLVAELPDGWFVVPSIQIPYREHPDEVGVVVVGPEYVMLIDQAAQRLSDATVLLSHNQRGRTVSAEAVLQVLGVHAARRRASETCGGYKSLDLLEEDQSGRLDEAEETVTG